MSCTVARTLTVPRPVEAVARYLSDFANSAVWIQHNESCERLDDGPVRVGAQFRTVARVGPLLETITQCVTEFDPGRRLVVHGRSTFLRTVDELTFTPTISGGAEITYTVTVDLVGRARFGSALLAPFLAVAADSGVTHLRTTLLDVVPAARTGPEQRPGSRAIRAQRSR